MRVLLPALLLALLVGSLGADPTSLSAAERAELGRGLQRVQALEAQGNLSHAQAVAESLWTRFGPEHGTGSTLLHLFRMAGDQAKERELLEQWLELTPSSAEACGALARLHEQEGRIQEAAAALVRSWGPDNASRFANELLRLERLHPGQVDLDLVAGIELAGPTLAARLALLHGKVAAAHGYLDRVQRIPAMELQRLLTAVERSAHRFPTVDHESLFERLRGHLPEEPEQVEIWRRHAQVLLEGGNPAGALRALDQAPGAGSAEGPVRRALRGRIELALGHPEVARGLLHEASTGDQLALAERTELTLLLGEAHLGLGQAALAIALADSLAEARPAELEIASRARFLGAEARLHAGDPAAALARYRELLALAPGALVANDALERAFLLTRLGLAAAPDSSGLLEGLIRAEALRLARRHAAAGGAYEACVEAGGPVAHEAAQRGAEAFARAGQVERGAKLLAGVAEELGRRPESAQLWLQRALLLPAAGDRREALSTLILAYPQSHAADEARRLLQKADITAELTTPE